MISLMPYIGGKHRLAKEIAKRLHVPGVDTLCEVFGGSAAVMLNAGFKKRVYNDANNDLVNFYRVLADRGRCTEMVRLLHAMPPSRTIYEQCGKVHGSDIERAAATIYRQMFAFGGKGRCGGLSVSLGDRHGIKEIVRYRSLLRRIESFSEFFGCTMIECADYQTIVTSYGQKANVVLYCDPPYVGTEHYYNNGGFSDWDHFNLAQMLQDIPAHVVLTYYDAPLIRSLYPESLWQWEAVSATKNCQFRSGHKQKVDEYIISKRLSPEA